MRMLLGLMWLLHWLPLPVLGRIGEAIGGILFALMKKRRHITLTNLRICLPQFSDRERKNIARRHFQSYVRAVLERSILWWASRERLQRLIRVEPALPLEAMQYSPTILLCPHFVCLDVAGVAIALHASACSIYTQQQNKIFDEALRKGRERFSPVKIFSRSAGIKPIIRAMREGLPFFMLPDMDFGAKDAEFVPFFGMPAATLTAPARIAAATGAKIMPVIATFLPKYQGWKVVFYPTWENYPDPDLLVATRRVNAFIEARVLESPHEYWWSHKRFKTRPPGSPSVYDDTHAEAAPQQSEPVPAGKNP